MAKKKIERQTFKVGDEVFWNSQAAGTSTRKQGVVIRVIGKGEYCPIGGGDLMKYAVQLGSTHPRDHENYLVVVPGKSKKAKEMLYRPVVSSLKMVVTYIIGV